jgi:transposase
MYRNRCSSPVNFGGIRDHSSTCGAPAYAQRTRSLLEVTDILDSHEARFAAMITERPDTHCGYQAIQQVPGIGPKQAAEFVAEIADVHRFTDPAHLCSWAGLTPRHRESDTVVHRGHITKQGSKAVRWAAIEAVQRHPTTAKISADKQRIDARRGKNIAKVAAARKSAQLTPVLTPHCPPEAESQQNHWPLTC